MAEAIEKLQEPAQVIVAEGTADEPTRPTSRATVDRNQQPSRPQRQFLNNAKVYMRRSSTEPFEFDMIVTGYEFDEARNGWDYWLKEDNRQALAWPSKVQQSNLKRRR